MRRSHTKKLLVALLMLLGSGWGAMAQSTTFNYTGGMQTYTAEYTGTLLIDMAGAQGGNYYTSGGNGGRVVCTLAVTAGQVLNINVGGQGSAPSGGYNGGGHGGIYLYYYGYYYGYYYYYGGGGGGASDIRIGGTDLADRVLVAGGGGGSGMSYNGGLGGGLTGGTEAGGIVGGGGPTSGGSGYGGGTSGGLGYGGNGYYYDFTYSAGGAGGGGYYGGGGAQYGNGGGGGSSYTHPTLATGVSHTQGHQYNNGYVIISDPCPMITTANTGICHGASLGLTASGMTTYTWAPAEGLSATTGASVTATPTVTTTYTVTGVADGCVAKTKTITVDVTTVSDPSVTSPLSISCGTVATLNATPSSGATLGWYTAPTGGTTFATGTTATVTPSADITYYAESFTSASGGSVTSIGTTATFYEHNTVTGDDRGGIAVSDNYVYYTGDSYTGRFNKSDLAGATSLSHRDGFFSDLSNGNLWQLATSSSGGGSLYGGGTIDRLYALDENLNTTGTVLMLSTPVYVSYGMVAAGSGFVILWDNSSTNSYHINLTTGTVTNLVTGSFSYQGCETWASYGWAEYDGTDYYMVYVGSGSVINKRNMTTGAVTTLQTFTSLSDMGAIIFSPSNNRMYYHHEGGSQFGGSDESIGWLSVTSTAGSGSADCASARTPVVVTVAPITVSATGDTTVTCGTSATLTGTGGTHYTWSPAAGLSATTGASVTATPSSTTTYTVTGSAGSSNIVYSQAFPGGVPGSSSTAQGIAWTTFLSSLVSTNTYLGFTIRGTHNTTGITCTNPTIAQNIANALRTGTTYSGFSDGHTWGVNLCGGTELWVDFNCDCRNPGYSLRPHNYSFGGVNTGTCDLIGQTMEVEFVVAGGSCLSSATVTVSVNPIVVSAGADVGICTGASTDLAATGGTYYSWSPSTGLSATTGASVTASPTVTTTYTVTGSTGSSSILYSQAFSLSSPGGPSSPQFTAWNAFRADLVSTNIYSGFTIKGTYSPTGNSCTDPTVAQAVAEALRTGTYYDGSSDGHTWHVRDCGGWELSMDYPCSCSANYTLRPGNENYFGAAGTTSCYPIPDQTLEVEFQISGGIGACSNTATVTVSVNAEAAIVATTGANGTISPLGTTSVCIGNSQVYTMTPDVDYHVLDVLVDGSSVGAVTSYTLTATASAHTINVTFESDCTTPPASTGTLAICNGSTTGLSNSMPGGTWSSSNTTIASVDAMTGIVTGNSVGNAYITYHTGDGPACYGTVQVTINAVPAPIHLLGPSTVCEGFTVGLSNPMGSGTWTSANTAVATIGLTSGILTGVSAGTAIITYTQYTGCYTTRVQTVNMVPATITGTPVFCTGNTSAFSTASTGGVWRSSHPSVASVDSVSGVATGVYGGMATIRYEMPTGCFSSIATTVNHLPLAITGALSMCEGGTATLSSTTTGGTWTSAATGTATIGASTGVVTGIAAGLAIISYTNSEGCARTAEVTVNTVPPAITGSASMCVGSTSALANATTGGTWSSSNTAKATVGLTTGIVNGISAGNATITYKVAGAGCFTTVEVTVNTTPAAITGTTTVCVGSSSTLSHPVSGGTWSSSNLARATVDASTGEFTGISIGSAFITYTTSPGCFKTIVVNVQALPTLTTAGIVCEGATTAIGYHPTGGTWASSSAANATVNTAGVVTGVLAGVSTISYTKSPGCMSTTEITVNPIPAVITGNAAVCIGNTETLSSAPGGGTWASSAPTIASIGSSTGDVTGVVFGNATITYTAGGCRRTRIVTVGTMPAAITGTLTVCAGSTTTLASATSGGTWSSSSANATVPTTGAAIVTGVSEGAATISYIKGGCVRTANVTVNPALTAITGDLLVCAGNTSALSNPTTGGTWTSSTASKATVNMTSGVMTGVSAGSSTITYRTATTCFTTAQATVNGAVAAITGTTNVCIGATTTLSTTATGGSWSSSNTARATVEESTGVVTGVATGTAIISYIQSTGCYKTITVVVNALPAAIAGTATVCEGSATTLSSTTGGGTWSSSTTAVATVTTAGSVAGVSEGTSTITYRLSSTGCIATREVSVNPLPSTISGPAPICAGTTNTFTATPTGGLWNSSTTSVATVGSSSGEVTGLISGSTTLSYTLPTGCRRTLAIGVNPMPNAITGTATLLVGTTTTLSSSTTGGTWSSSNNEIATVSSGVVSGIDAGTATITYQLTSTGCYRTREVTVNFLSSSKPAASVEAASMFNVFPNPSAGTLNVTASVKGIFTVYTLDGKLVEQYTVSSTAVTLSLPYNLAAGVYMCRFNGEDGSVKMVRLVYQP